jgi:hypothetical protein
MLDDHHVDVAALVVDAVDQPVVASTRGYPRSRSPAPNRAAISHSSGTGQAASLATRVFISRRRNTDSIQVQRELNTQLRA